MEAESLSYQVTQHMEEMCFNFDMTRSQEKTLLTWSEFKHSSPLYKQVITPVLSNIPTMHFFYFLVESLTLEAVFAICTSHECMVV